MANNKNIELTVNGIPLSGFADTDHTLSPEVEEDINIDVGVKGEESISENVDSRGVLEVGFLKTASDTLAILEGLRALRTSFPILWKDFSPDALLFQASPNARILNKPTHTRAKDGAEAIVYRFHLPIYGPIPIPE